VRGELPPKKETPSRKRFDYSRSAMGDDFAHRIADPAQLVAHHQNCVSARPTGGGAKTRITSDKNKEFAILPAGWENLAGILEQGRIRIGRP
jgi:hypothetical protein